MPPNLTTTRTHPQVCYGWRSGQDASKDQATMGRCLNATARFTPSTSTRIFFENTTSTRPVMLLAKEWDSFNQQYGWPPDPVWTESDWTESSPTVTVYMAEAKSVQVTTVLRDDARPARAPQI